MFLRDAKQAEVLLSQQDNFLSKEEVPVSIQLKYKCSDEYGNPPLSSIYRITLVIVCFTTIPVHISTTSTKNIAKCFISRMLGFSLLVFQAFSQTPVSSFCVCCLIDAMLKIGKCKGKIALFQTSILNQIFHSQSWSVLIA